MKQTTIYFLFGMILASIIYLALQVIRILLSNKLTVSQFLQKIEKDEYDYLLDVRTPEEWNEGHHNKATLIPISNFVTELPKLISDKKATILIYCKKGIRAEATAKIAERLGYKNVYWMDGKYEDLNKLII
jgi:rhodanese-related sulfurtransferase